MRSRDRLSPELVRELAAQLRKCPDITVAADACGVHPRQVVLWIKEGMYPSATAEHGALARAARRSLASVKGRLWESVFMAATGYVDIDGVPQKGDPKWAAFLLDRLKDDRDQQWADTLPGPEDRAAVRRHMFQQGDPQLLADIEAAGFKLVPIDDRETPPPLLQGELED